MSVGDVAKRKPHESTWVVLSVGPDRVSKAVSVVEIAVS